MVHEWMTKRHKSASFIHYTKDTLEYIQKLGLSWCKCIAYKSGNFGGWVSENYLAIGRLLPWFYGSIDHIAEDPRCGVHHKNNGLSNKILLGCQYEV
jgi:hypothetical protein